jgi:hypothetical protein
MMDDARLAVRVIDPDLEAQRIEKLIGEADARTCEMLERYGALFPVTFGQCGHAGLCILGTTRSFCIGCGYLIRRPEYLDRVDYFLESYTSTAEAHDRMGDIAGARERRCLTGELRQLRHEMVLLAEAEHDRAIANWPSSSEQICLGCAAAPAASSGIADSRPGSPQCPHSRLIQSGHSLHSRVVGSVVTMFFFLIRRQRARTTLTDPSSRGIVPA